LKEDPKALPEYGADGDFGPETESAVYSLQRRCNYNGEIKEDGIVGAQTIAILDVVMVYDLIVQTIENSPLQFGSMTSVNPIYWKTEIPNDKYHPREGFQTWEAVYALYDPLLPTTVECFMGVNAFYMKAVTDTLGKDVFSEYFRWKSDSDAGLYLIKPIFAPNDRLLYLLDEFPYDIQQVKLGDWCYYKNDERYGAKHPNDVWSGENSVYVGNMQYRGHGLTGPKNEEDLFLLMKDAFDSDSQDPASDPSLANAKTYRKTPGVPFGVIGFEYIFRLHLGKLSLIKRDPQREPFKS
jgi:hypothetical protein